MGFFGHAYATASYLVNHSTFGWLGFGGAVAQLGDRIRIEPKDSARNRLFVEPAGVWVTLQAGKIQAAEYFPKTGALELKLAPANAHTKKARLSVQTTTGERGYALRGFAVERGLYTIPLGNEPSHARLAPQ
jgi:hypothetical protein